MAQILVKAIDATHPDAINDRVGCYKRGMPVVVMPDSHTWGAEERPPKFIVLKIPGVPVETVKKYIEPELEDSPGEDKKQQPKIYRRRMWRFRIDHLPAAAKTKLLKNGELTIRAGTYDGSYDYTWAQVRSYIRNLKTNTDETENL